MGWYPGGVCYRAPYGANNKFRAKKVPNIRRKKETQKNDEQSEVELWNRVQIKYVQKIFRREQRSNRRRCKIEDL